MAIETLRGKPRIVVWPSGEFRDLDHHLDVEPHAVTPAVAIGRSLTGRVQTQYRRQQVELRLKQEDISREEADFWRRVFYNNLAKGESIAVIRDKTRGMAWSGSDPQARDQAMGLLPYDASGFSLVTRGSAFASGQSFAEDAMGVGPTDRSTFSRLTPRWELFVNGDFLDGAYGALPSGWTNATPTTVGAGIDAWLPPSSRHRNLRLWSKSPGTKTVYADFNVSVAVGALTHVTVSFLHRMDRKSEVAGNAITIKLKDAGSADEVIIFDGEPESYFDRVVTYSNISAWADIGQVLRLEISGTDALEMGSYYITDISVQEDYAISPGLVYSPTRGLTGNRLGANLHYLNFFNGLYQLPTAIAGGRVAFTWAGWVTPGGSDTEILDPGWMILRIGDLSDALAGGVLTSPTQIAYAPGTPGIQTLFHTTDNTNHSLAGASLGSWAGNEPKHIIASWVDWDGANAGSGEALIYVDGTLNGSNTHSKSLGRLGNLLSIGEMGVPGDTLDASLWFNHVFIDHLFCADVGDLGYSANSAIAYPVSTYYAGLSAPYPSAWLQNAWRAVLSPRQKDEPIMLKRNSYSLDLQLLAIPWS